MAKLNLLAGYMKLLYSSDTIQGQFQEFQKELKIKTVHRTILVISEVTMRSVNFDQE